jgi:uncharacterized protein YuzE
MGWGLSCSGAIARGRLSAESSRETDLRISSMKLTYDPRRNIGYLRFHEKTAEVETIQVSDSLNVDIVPDGTIYGIELLDANEQLRGDNGGHFVIVNEAAGKTEDIALEI